MALNSAIFKRFEGQEFEGRMTIQGSVQRIAMLLAFVSLSAVGSWYAALTMGDAIVIPALLASLAALVVGIHTARQPRHAPVTAPVYAILEGVALGSFSVFFEQTYPGIVFPAVLLTFGILLAVLVIYRLSGYQVGRNFYIAVTAATGAVVLVYLVNLGLWLFGSQGLPFITGGWESVVFSVAVIVIAALNLVIDFDVIETGARQGAPEYMEWYAAFGLMVTLIWIYWEILRLLIQLYASSDND